MRENVTISYRGASYEIGRGPGFYGIWPAAEQQPQPIEWWPETPEGWYGAWARFTRVEAPGTIAPVGPPGPATAAEAAGATTEAAGVAVPAGQPGPATAAGGPGAIATDGLPAAGPARGSARAVIPAALLAIGVACGIAGIFPDYFGGASLASQPAEVVPHVIYLAAWTASAVLILLGGRRLRVGALLGAGTSVVTLGLFLADLGTATAGGAHPVGAGLVLGLIGWLGCAVGSGIAVARRGARAPGRPRGSLLTLTLAPIAALGAAIAFAPSWDSFTAHSPTGATLSRTAGNAFANPGLVITADVVVMVALVAIVVVAALWRPVGQGAALLAGAIVVMVAQAISALVQLGEPTSPLEFGITPAQAAQAGITISSGVTPAFWIFCAFVVALALTCAQMLIPARPAALTAAPPAAGTFGSASPPAGQPGGGTW